MANSYDPGDVVRFTVAFTVAGVATDPTTVAVKVASPTGAKTTYTYAGAQVVKDSTGNYHYDLDLTNAAPGSWFYRWEGTGAAQAVSPDTEFVVRRTVF